MSKQKAELLKLSKNFPKSSDKARAKEQWPPVFLCQTMHDLMAVFELNLKILPPYWQNLELTLCHYWKEGFLQPPKPRSINISILTNTSTW